MSVQGRRLTQTPYNFRVGLESTSLSTAKTDESNQAALSAVERDRPSRYVPRALLVILRVYVGVILFISDLGKLTRDNPFANEMLGFLGGVTKRRASAPYLDFVQRMVIPHATLFSYLVMTGEAFAALSLLTGTLTRLGPGVAMFLFLNYMLAEGRIFWSPDSEDAALFFIALVLLIGRAGRVWGIDSYLARRWPRSPLW